jgi:flavin-dependent dehydrogenase
MRNRIKWEFEYFHDNRKVACSCRFLVDATGRSGSSWLGNLSSRIVLDRLIGVAWTGNSSSSSPYLVVEPINDGWFYSTTLPGGKATIAYMTDSDLYRRESERIPRLWHRQLDQTTYARERFSPYQDRSRLQIVSAATVIRAMPVGKDWCAVGDAAFSHDPLSGLGVHHALESATHAASGIGSLLTRGRPLSTYESWIAKSLRNYLRSRRHYYAKERRWPTSPFWQRRTLQHESSAVAAMLFNSSLSEFYP